MQLNGLDVLESSAYWSLDIEFRDGPTHLRRRAPHLRCRLSVAYSFRPLKATAAPRMMLSCRSGYCRQKKTSQSRTEPQRELETAKEGPHMVPGLRIAFGYAVSCSFEASICRTSKLVRFLNSTRTRGMDTTTLDQLRHLELRLSATDNTLVCSTEQPTVLQTFVFLVYWEASQV